MTLVFPRLFFNTYFCKKNNLMKKIITLALSLATTFAFAQSKSETNWPQLKTFHSVMAQTFHPSEEGNLQPVKERIDEFVDKAEALAKSAIPADFDAKKIKDAADRLVAGAKELKAMIAAKEKDDVIMKKLSALHDVFHEIAGLCKKGDSQEEHGHEHNQH